MDIRVVDDNENIIKMKGTGKRIRIDNDPKKDDYSDANKIDILVLFSLLAWFQVLPADIFLLRIFFYFLHLTGCTFILISRYYSTSRVMTIIMPFFTTERQRH